MESQMGTLGQPYYGRGHGHLRRPALRPLIVIGRFLSWLVGHRAGRPRRGPARSGARHIRRRERIRGRPTHTPGLGSFPGCSPGGGGPDGWPRLASGYYPRRRGHPPPAKRGSCARLLLVLKATGAGMSAGLPDQLAQPQAERGFAQFPRHLFGRHSDPVSSRPIFARDRGGTGVVERPQ